MFVFVAICPYQIEDSFILKFNTVEEYEFYIYENKDDIQMNCALFDLDTLKEIRYWIKP